MCHRGPIQDVSLTEPFKRYSEKETRSFFREIILGVEYLHENGIVHRDLKQDNILVLKNGTLKIVDFGVSEMFTGGNDKIKGTAGSPAFMAPELLMQGRPEFSAKATDLWAMGIILYGLYFGSLPFTGGNIIEIRESILTQEVVFPGAIKPEFEDLIKELLNKNAEERMAMDELRVHPWVTVNGTEPLITLEENTKHVVQEITEDDVSGAIKTIGSVLLVVKAVNRFKNLRKSVNTATSSP